MVTIMAPKQGIAAAVLAAGGSLVLRAEVGARATELCVVRSAADAVLARAIRIGDGYAPCQLGPIISRRLAEMDRESAQAELQRLTGHADGVHA